MSRAREGSELITAYDSGKGLSFRNRIINGDMRIDQRNNGASFNNSNAATYCADRWISYGLSGAVLAIQQVTDAPTGFTNSIKCTVSTATTANDGGSFAQKIEANNCADLSFGTANAQPVTLTFWVKSSVTGQHNMVVQYFGSSSTQYYCSAYTVNSANTWEQKTVIVPACTTGGAFTGALNAQYLAVSPTTFQSSGNTTFNTANTWTSTASTKLSGTVNLASTANATVQITGVQLEAGSVATPFERRDYGRELMMCQRYFCKTFSQGTAPAENTGNTAAISLPINTSTNTQLVWTEWVYPITMRSTPTILTYNPSAANSNWRNSAGTADFTVSTGGTTSENRLQIRAANVTSGQGAYIHLTASAEL